MTNPTYRENSVLSRKLAAGAAVETADDRTTLRALRTTLARAAQDEMGLPLGVIGIGQSREGQGDLDDSLNPDFLAILLDGPGEQNGAVCLDAAFVTAIIQHQTTGVISPNASGNRKFTATDAAMTAPLIDAVLQQMETAAETPSDQKCFAGYSFGARVANAGDLLMSLTAEWYRKFALTVDLGRGASQGQMLLLMPEPELCEDNIANMPETGPGLAAAFDVLRADLTANLCRLQIPLAQLSELRAGDVIVLPNARFDHTELATIDGQVIALCRLGQMTGMRAVRTNETTEEPAETNGRDDTFTAASTSDDKAPGPRNELAKIERIPEADISDAGGNAAADLTDGPDDLASEISRLAGLSGADFPAIPSEAGVQDRDQI